ncbi:Ger(x)C family spore germination C-terminal domain-containing protein [Paenibacillus illinoisensis]|uniref:Ger(x)C family spore germination C-terminal domain-containing protein n=1 Tax=Paenibacillus illinoisensis TaxID=59845 RepID=UPI0030178DA6
MDRTRSKRSEEYLSELEDEFTKIAEQQVKPALDKIQHKYKVDVGGFGEQLRIKYPKVCRKVKPDWDKRFSEVPITYDIKIKLENQGSSTD